MQMETVSPDRARHARFAEARKDEIRLRGRKFLYYSGKD